MNSFALLPFIFIVVTITVNSIRICLAIIFELANRENDKERPLERGRAESELLSKERGLK